MKRRLDLSVGQRLTLGFGAAGALIVLMTVISHLGTARVEQLRTHLTTVTRARADAAARLERAVLRLAIASRSAVLAPDAGHRSAYQEAERRARAALQALLELPGGAAGGELARLPALFDRYQAAAGALVEAARTGGRLDGLEPEIAAAREELLAGLQAYAALQEEQLDAGRATVTRAVIATDRSIMGLGAVLVLVLAITALVTTRSVRRPALALVASARRLGAGDFAHAVELAGGPDASRHRRDELVELAHAFGRMALELRTREERLQAGAALAAALARTLERGRICAGALEVILGHLGVECAAVYLADEEGRLHLEHGVGLAGGDETMLPGQGIPGRAAAAGRTVVVDVPPDSPFTLRLGVDRLPPRAVAAAPMVLQDRLVAGVLVVASARPIPADAVGFLERAAVQVGVALQNAHGHERIRRLAAELQDRTERLQVQREELQAQNEELQAQQEELQSQNEELQAQSDELRHTEEALRQADRNKNEFLAVLSHELRNPLAPIQNSLHILDQARPGSDQARRAQAVVARQVRHLTRLVEDLLDLTRISNGKVRLRRTTVELARLVRQVAEDNAALFAGRGIELSVQVEAEPRIDGDPARLAQILGNLLQNAAKFTPRGGRVRLALELAGARARVRVRDTGAGLDRETLGRLFQPFMQADVTLARTDGGLGLGLALVKGLVELHGGTVRAESDGPGRGAEFVIELPAHEGPPVALPAAEPPRRHRRRVLVIEDNVDAAESLRDALALEGHEVEVAFRGADGIARARSWAPDVVLCDIGLPDIEGHEVARAFRGDPALRHTFLVALTGYALPEDQQRAREAGFDEHLAKPPSMGRLAELLHAAGVQRAAG